MAKINGVYIDNILASAIERFKDEVLNKDKDKHLLIDGREGSGKSIFAMQLAKALDKDFNIDKIAFNSDQFISLVKDTKRKKGDCILLDEAFSSASARSSLSQINKAMIAVATEMRQLNLFIIIVLPSFFDLDKYFAIWRCDTLLHVYFNKKGDRGQYIIFPFKKKLKLYINGKKTYNYNVVKSPYPACRFEKLWVVDEFQYRERKAKAFRTRQLGVRDLRWKNRCLKLMNHLFYDLKYSNEEIGKVIEETEASVKETRLRGRGRQLESNNKLIVTQELKNFDED